MRYSVIAARDGDVYHDSVEAADNDEAYSLARRQLAEAWDMTDTLQEFINEDDEEGFDGEFDGFAVDPDMADRVREAGDALCELLEEAYEVHIYDRQNDDVPDPKDCPYQQAIASWKEARNA